MVTSLWSSHPEAQARQRLGLAFICPVVERCSAVSTDRMQVRQSLSPSDLLRMRDSTNR